MGAAVWQVGRGVLTKLRGKLGVTRLEQTDQRTVAKRATDRLHFREFVAAAEHVEKGSRLAT